MIYACAVTFHWQTRPSLYLPIITVRNDFIYNAIARQADARNLC